MGDGAVALRRMYRFSVWPYTGDMHGSTDRKQTPKGPDARQIEHVPSWLLDLLLGVAVALVIALVISVELGGTQEPDLIAYLFAAGFGSLMLVRRRFPVAVLVATMFLLFAYYTLGYPAIGLAVPVAAALYSAAELGHLIAAIAVSIILVIVSTYFRLLGGEPPAYLGYELVSTVTLMAAAIALGDGTRSRRALRAEQAQTARLIEREHAYRAEQRVQAERVRMARDLHDVIGHSISVISLHTDIAREAVGHDDDQARQALAQVRSAASETMRELRATVKLLRQPMSGEPDRASRSLESLSTLVEHARGSGLAVDVQVDGELARLPARLDTAAYRIIQESLTNVIRHAEATRVTLAIAVDGQALRLRIADNGMSSSKVIGPGSGIDGMKERANLLGGTLTARPLSSGGFEVQAILPLEDAS